MNNTNGNNGSGFEQAQQLLRQRFGAWFAAFISAALTTPAQGQVLPACRSALMQRSSAFFSLFFSASRAFIVFEQHPGSNTRAARCAALHHQHGVFGSQRKRRGGSSFEARNFDSDCLSGGTPRPRMLQRARADQHFRGLHSFFCACCSAWQGKERTRLPGPTGPAGPRVPRGVAPELVRSRTRRGSSAGPRRRLWKRYRSGAALPAAGPAPPGERRRSPTRNTSVL
jgi:hypothetical protein